MGAAVPWEDREARVDELIAVMGLIKAQDTPIGVLGKGISGHPSLDGTHWSSLLPR